MDKRALLKNIREKARALALEQDGVINPWLYGSKEHEEFELGVAEAEYEVSQNENPLREQRAL